MANTMNGGTTILAISVSYGHSIDFQDDDDVDSVLEVLVSALPATQQWNKAFVFMLSSQGSAQ